jgi:SAM-dependent methyltransferase
MKPRGFDELEGQARAFRESRILLTAIELDLFTAVGEGASAAEVARNAATEPRATEMLLNALAALGALAKSAGIFRNTAETAQHLAAASPECERDALMHTVHMWDRWSTLTECVRTGAAQNLNEIEGRGEKWIGAFIAAMHRTGKERAPEIAEAVGAAGVRRMLDVGGGSGAYSIAFAQADPELRAEILDLEPVLPIAQAHIARAGLSKRVTTRAGDLRRDPLGEGLDLILLSAICHMLSVEENRDLLRRALEALAPRGRVVIRDFILNRDKTGPPAAAIFSLNMLVGTAGGASYSEIEYTVWLEEAGFRDVRRIRFPDPSSGLMEGTR